MATRQRASNGHASSKQQSNLVTISSPAMSPTPVSATRTELIAVRAYLRAAERGFAPGHELEDWLAAERELEANDATALQQ